MEATREKIQRKKKCYEKKLKIVSRLKTVCLQDEVIYPDMLITSSHQYLLVLWTVANTRQFFCFAYGKEKKEEKGIPKETLVEK